MLLVWQFTVVAGEQDRAAQQLQHSRATILQLTDSLAGHEIFATHSDRIRP